MPRFELGQFLDLIERHGVTRAYIVPAMAVTLADADLEGRDMTSLRHVLSAAAPLGTALTEALQRARLPGQRGIRNDRDKRHYAPGAARGRASQIWIDRAPRSRVSSVVWSIPRPAQRWPRESAASSGC